MISNSLLHDDLFLVNTGWGVGGKMTRIEILGYVDLLVFPADGTKPILPVREVAAVFADSDVAPPVCHVDQSINKIVHQSE